jgi:hypothetical protein
MEEYLIPCWAMLLMLSLTLLPVFAWRTSLEFSESLSEITYLLEFAQCADICNLLYPS